MSDTLRSQSMYKGDCTGRCLSTEADEVFSKEKGLNSCQAEMGKLRAVVEQCMNALRREVSMILARVGEHST